MALRTCPACGAAALLPLVDLGLVPVLSGVTYPAQEDALRSPVGRLTLAHCPACALVYNAAFEPELIDYDIDYDNTLHYSPTFRTFSDRLVRELVAKYDLGGRHVVELGCGKGHFLVDLCRAADARGTGYDRSYAGDVTDPHVEFVRDYLPLDEPGNFDFFVSRHVLEHLAEPFDFLSGLRRVCAANAVRGYIEVPDAIYDFERSPWNCHYPHVSYFSATSLARLAARAGFAVLRLARSFEGQYLSLELGANVPTPDEIPLTGMGLRREREILADFARYHDQLVAEWRSRLEALGYGKTVLWGAGAKGLGFVNAVDPQRRLAAVVDLNPAKTDHFLPVTGHRIVGIEQLRSMDISTVVITNPAYEQEIEAAVRELGLGADVVSAH